MKKLVYLLLTLLPSLNFFAANRYWVGGSGSWTTISTTNWASSSGGTSGASVPTSSDDVFFDANSFSAVSQVVTLGSSTISCKSINWSGATNTPTLDISGNNLDIYGSATFVAGMSIDVSTSSSWLRFKATTTGFTITTAGNAMPTTYFSGSGGGWTLQDSYNTSSRSFNISAGTLTTNNQSLTCGSFSFSGGTFTCGTSVISPTSVSISGGSWTFGANVTNSGSTTISSGTLNTNGYTYSTTSLTVSGGTLTCGASTINATTSASMSSGTFTCNSSTLNTPAFSTTGGSINFGTSTFNLTGSSSNELSIGSSTTVTTGTSTFNFTGANNSGTSPIEIYLGTKQIYNIAFSTGTYSVSIFDGGTINNVSLPASSWLIFESSKTVTFTGIITPSTSCQTYSLFTSSTPGTAATISLSASQTAMNYVQIRDITNSGTNMTCTSCVNTGTNSGFTFSSPYTARSLYWMGSSGGTGNWGTGSNWTANSDGTSSSNTCVPTIIDAVYFNAPSFDAASKTVTIDQRVTAASINFTGTTNSPAISNPSAHDIVVTGTLTLTSGIGTITNTGSVYLIGTSAQLVTCGGKRLSSGTTFFSNTSTIYLEDDGYFGTVYIKNGTLDVQNQAGNTVNNMYFSGDWYLTGTFQPRSNSSKYTIFNGTSDGTIYSNTTYYNLKVDNSSSAYLITSADVTITNELLITGGTYKNTNSKTTTVSGSVNITSTTSTAYLYLSSGTFSYLNNSTTNFNHAKGYIWAWGGTLNIGVAGSHTTTVLNIGNGVGSTGEAVIYAWGSTINIADRLITYSDGIFDMTSGTVNIKTNTTDGGTAGTAKWQMNASGQFKSSGGTINVLGASDNNTTNAISFSTSSTFTAGNITGGTVVLQSTTSTYNYPVDFGGKTLYHLTVNQSSRTITMTSNSVTLKGNLTLTAGTFDANGQNINVAGNWTNNSTYTNSGSANTVTFNGGSAQSINGSTSSTLNNVTINNSSTGVSLGINTTFNNTLTLSLGKLITQGYTLTVGTSSTNGSISAGSSSSYIVAYNNSGTYGYLKQFINSNTTYNFPVGDNSNFTPLTFTLNSNGGLSSAYLTIFTNATTIPGMNSSLTTYISRYWDVANSGLTTPNYDISYVYATGDITGTEANLLPIKKSGSTWYKPTGSSFTTGTTQGSGSVTTGTNTLSWTGLSTFSMFSGAGNQSVPLPIELISFNAKMNNNQVVDLNWETASEINNDYFTIEKSKDGILFSELEKIEGAGNSTQLINYSTIDRNPFNGISYYRLKQTDFDGRSSYSSIVSVNKTSDLGTFIIYPNPNNGKEFAIDSDAKIQNKIVSIFDQSGMLIESLTILENGLIHPAKTLTSGIYFIHITSNEINSIQKMIVY